MTGPTSSGGLDVRAQIEMEQQGPGASGRPLPSPRPAVEAANTMSTTEVTPIAATTTATTAYETPLLDSVTVFVSPATKVTVLGPERHDYAALHLADGRGRLAIHADTYPAKGIDAGLDALEAFVNRLQDAVADARRQHQARQAGEK